MPKPARDRRKLIICLFVLAVSAWDGTAADSREVEVDGLPCNDLCQAWLGYRGGGDRVGSGVGKAHPIVRPSIRYDRSMASRPPSEFRRPETAAARMERGSPTPVGSAPKLFRSTASAKRVRAPIRVAQESVPLPSLRPGTVSDRPAVPVKAPAPPADRPPKPSPGANEAAVTSNTGVRRGAPLGSAPPPAVDRPAAADAPSPAKEPTRNEPPAAAAVVTPPAASPPPRAPRVAAAGPIGEEAEPSAHVPPAPAPVAAAPSTVVASLPPRAEGGSSLRNDDPSGRDTQEGVLRPLPGSAGDSVSVKIGQISAEPRGTDVHVVVVNVLQHEMKDVDVRCRAQDAQGLQVAESSARIASIAPSDVAFGQVLFPSEITTRDNKFTCEVGRIAAAEGATP